MRKGFIYDFKAYFPGPSFGIDISDYAVAMAEEEIKPCMKVGVPTNFPTKTIVLISSSLSIPYTTFRSIDAESTSGNQVTRRHAFITVDAWRNDQERENMLK